MGMGTDVFLQLGILMFTLLIFYSLFHLPRRALSTFRRTTKSATQSHRHFIHAAHLLSKAKSTRTTTSAAAHLAKSAVHEVDKALAINPKDPSSHILKALALDMMGHKAAALRSLDVALSVPVVKRYTTNIQKWMQVYGTLTDLAGTVDKNEFSSSSII